MDKLILDASVVTASLLPDEPYREPALRVLARFLSDPQALELLTVPLLKYEVTNALWKALKTGRVRLPDVEEAIKTFEAFNLPEREVSGREVLRIARRYDRSAYDSAYLALAQAEKAPLITADKRLYHALQGRFRRLIWVEDFE